MGAEPLIYLGAALPLLWGIAHLFPTRSIVKGFGDISADNKHIITMEWLVEGVALIFIGILVAVVTITEAATLAASAVYITASVCLIVLAIISMFTGFKINFPVFKLCPVIFLASAILISLGWLLLPG